MTTVRKLALALLLPGLAVFGVGLSQDDDQNQTDETQVVEQETRTVGDQEFVPFGRSEVGEPEDYDADDEDEGAIIFTGSTPDDQHPNVDVVGPDGFYESFEFDDDQGEERVVDGLRPGIYSIAATDDGLELVHTMVEVTAGKAIRVDLALEQLSEEFRPGRLAEQRTFPRDGFRTTEPAAFDNEQFGAVTVETDDEDARFVITGSNNYSREFSGEFTAEDLPPGVYVIAGTDDESQVTTTMVEVQAAQATRTVPTFAAVPVEVAADEDEGVAGGGEGQEAEAEEAEAEEAEAEEAEEPAEAEEAEADEVETEEQQEEPAEPEDAEERPEDADAANGETAEAEEVEAEEAEFAVDESEEEAEPADAEAAEEDAEPAEAAEADAAEAEDAEPAEAEDAEAEADEVAEAETEEAADTDAEADAEAEAEAEAEEPEAEAEAEEAEAEAEAEAEEPEAEEPEAEAEEAEDGEVAGGGLPATPEIGVESSSSIGDYLVDAEGRSLYVFEADSEGQSACTGECLAAWPPVLVEDQPQAADGVDESLLGTLEREDGIVQLTYDGKPLYYFVNDVEPGDTEGHHVEGFGGEWYLISPEGEPLAEQ